MEVFGYDKKDEEFEKCLPLSQVTLSCKKEDIDKIIEFLNEVKKDCKNEKIENGDHWHYRDFNDSWTEEEPDFIIYIENT